MPITDATRLAVEDLSGFYLCGTCGGLFESSPQPGFPSPQRCSCGTHGEPRWPIFDFNQHVDLCWCCRMELLISGSRWSYLLCGECQRRARDLNSGAGGLVIPIGRHSIMSGVAMEGGPHLDDGATRERALSAFADQMNDWMGSMDRLRAFKRARTVELVERLGLPEADGYQILEWLGKLEEAAAREPAIFGKQASFEALKRWFGTPPE